MDLTSPFNFDIAAMQLVYTPQGVLFAEKINKGDKILANLNTTQELANNLALGNKKALQIIFKNGNSIIVGEGCKVYTPSGWIDPSSLKSKDYVLHKIVLKGNQNQGSLPINYVQEFKTSAMPIYVPKKNSEAFAEWLGIFYALGEFNLYDGKISIHSNDDSIINEYINLTEQIFRLKPLLYQDKRENRKKEYYFTSQNVTKFLNLNVGRRHLKKIPHFLLEGSNEEHLAFLTGLSCEAKLHQDKYLVAYQGDSKLVADFVSLVLRNNGYTVSQQKGDFSKNQSRADRYMVLITGRHIQANRLSLFKQNIEKYLNVDLSVMVDITKQYDQLKVQSFHPNYRLYKELAKKEFKICSWQIAKNLGVDLSSNEYYYVPVSKIKEIKAIKQVNLKVLYTEGLLLNNVVLSGNY
jgi:hypothetical protein